MVYLIGIDIGTSSVKTVLVDRDFQTVAVASRSYPINHPHLGWAELSCETLWKKILSCLEELGQQADISKTVGIGISCLCPGLVAIGDSLEPLTDAIIYQDRRSGEESQIINERIGAQKLFEITGNKIMAGAISATSMLWIKKNLPEVYAATRWFGHLNTYICARMTGQVAIDPSNASYTGLYETYKGGSWSDELCDAWGIPKEKLPPIIEAYEKCGTVCNEEILQYGISAGTPVVIGGADTPCGAVACGVIGDGDLYQSIGTTDVFSICSAKPEFSPLFLNRRHVLPERWIFHGAQSNTGTAMSWFVDTFCKDLAQGHGEKNTFQLIDEEAAESKEGAAGVVFLPYLTGERCPVWDPKAKGVFFGLTAETKRKDLYRALLESSCYGLRQIIENTESLIGRPVDRIVSVGGGVRSDVWNQIRADITGKTFCIRELENAPAVGAAILAAIGVGMYESVDEACKKTGDRNKEIIKPSQKRETEEIYKKNYDVYQKLYANLKSIWQE